MPALEVEELTVRYGPFIAVEDVSFDAGAGEVLALLGPNGAGKTTTVETIEGYRKPAVGRVRALGLDPLADRRRLLPRLGAMPQSSRLYVAIRPIEALRQFAAFYPRPADPAELLERVGLTSRAAVPWRKLSGGEQQRLSLALALVGRPEVALLDEPTAGLDVEGRRLVRALIAELRDEGVCVVLTTHELDEAERLADRVVIIDRGRVIASGRLDELADQAGPPLLRFAAQPGLPVDQLSDLLGTVVAEPDPGEYVAETAPTPSIVAALTAWLAERDVPLADLRAGRHRLEDVFRRLTENQPTGDLPPESAGRPAGEHQRRARPRQRR